MSETWALVGRGRNDRQQQQQQQQEEERASAWPGPPKHEESGTRTGARILNQARIHMQSSATLTFGAGAAHDDPTSLHEDA